MANILRDLIPKAYELIHDALGDPVSYKRGAAEPFATTAVLLSNVGDEAVKNGNSIQLFMSLAALNAVPPAVGDLVTFAGVQYRVVDPVSNDYDGFQISGRRT